MTGVSKKMKTFTREIALSKSTEYFKGNEMSAENFVDKYALKNEKLELMESTPAAMHERLASEFSRIENKFPNPDRKSVV